MGLNLPIVYEDDWLLAVNKPSGLLVIPAPRNEPRTLTSILNEELKRSQKAYRLYPCHRLDRETSGLIIYAKGKSMQKKMMQEFKLRRIFKRYIAFVHGRLLKAEGELTRTIDNLSAITKYRVIEQKKDFAVVEVVPLTGRTNQIRIHFKQIAHPLVGETRFAFRRDFKLKAKRLLLHARYLEFIHPVTKQRICLDTQLPQYMRDFLKTNA